jgi:NlpC/P60 family putative phage cell wall peptidase
MRSNLHRAAILEEAAGWLGTPYRHQASARGRGADCLGLLRGVCAAVWGKGAEAPPPYPPRLRKEDGEPLLAAAERFLLPVSQAEPGDVLLFRMRPSLPVGHCGILLPEGRFIHAYEGQCVLTSPFDRFWRERLAASFSIPEAP